MVNRPRTDFATHKQQIKQSFADGFQVMDIKSRPTKDETKNASSYFTDEVIMSTPYKYNGNPLVAYCQVKHEGLDNDMQVSDFELWTSRDGKTCIDNLEDVYEKEHGTRDWKVTSGENIVGMADAEEAVADCAAATVQLPHVMHYDEYMSFQKRNYQRLKMDQPSEESYTAYLESCENQIKSKTVPYVGEIRTADKVMDRQQELPSFQHDMAEFLAESAAHDMDPDFRF